jgi:hypothetical protein
MLAQNWTYTVVETETGMTMTVVEKATGRTKSFFRAMHGEQARLGLCSFMESLTDENCEGYFPREKAPKKEKKQT